MAKPKMHTDYVLALKRAKKEHPFSLLPAQIPENSGNYCYPLRKTTVSTTVKLIQPILEAIRMYSRNENTFIETPYIMVVQPIMGSKGTLTQRYLLETLDADGNTLLIEACNEKIRISKIDAVDPNDSCDGESFAKWGWY